MTLRQQVLKIIYPFWMWWSRTRGKNSLVLEGKVNAPASFYELYSILGTGEIYNFEKLKGKKVLIVNTASDCGYTNQYGELQELSDQYLDRLVIIGFPSNEFKRQEKQDNRQIVEFCRSNFGVSFPIMEKSSVLRSANQNEVYKWLTDPSQNGWNYKQPSWNFCKYLVDENGNLVNYFGSAISPLSKIVIQSINK